MEGQAVVPGGSLPAATRSPDGIVPCG